MPTKASIEKNEFKISWYHDGKPDGRADIRRIYPRGVYIRKVQLLLLAPEGDVFRFLYPSLLSLLLDGDYPDGGHWYISLAYPLKKKHLIFMFFLSIQKRTAYILNLRGSDIPYNPLFHAYLFVGLESAVLFVEKSKVQDGI